MTFPWPIFRTLWWPAPDEVATVETVPDAVIVAAGGDRAAVLHRVAQVQRRAPKAALVLQLSAADRAADLHGFTEARPDALFLSGCIDAAAIQRWGARLAVAEAEAGRAAGSVGIIAAPAAAGLLAVGTLAGASARLMGLALDPAAIPLGLAGDPATAPLLDTLLLLGAAAAGRPAYRLLPPGAQAAEAARWRGLGYAGLIARGVSPGATG